LPAVLASITFTDSILALHIAAVVIAFGVTFAYPVLFAVAARSDRRLLPAVWQMVRTLGQRVVMPGLVVVVLAGIYLASKEDQWSHFYVGWGIVVALAIGAIYGALIAPTEQRLVELAERDVAAAGEGPLTLGADYETLARRWNMLGGLNSLLVLATIFVMANHIGA
jgi:hypothetical protein